MARITRAGRSTPSWRPKTGHTPTRRTARRRPATRTTTTPRPATPRSRAPLALLLCFALAACAPPRPQDGPLTLTAEDGLEVAADWHLTARGTPLGVIALFHQGGGEVRGEYERILPRILELGYDVIATDLRRGGSRFGLENRTAPPGSDSLFTYCDALPDVLAARAEASRFSDEVLLWGSSFSAALVVQAAALEQAGIAGVLAFSPASGDPMEGCRPESVSGDLSVPLLVLRPANEAAIPSVRAQLAEFEAQGHVTHVADPGVHGSSMLDAQRVGAATGETWRVVEAFLAGVAAQ